MGFNVAVRCEGLGMTEPKRDNFQGDASLQQTHGARMSEGVAGDSPLAEGRADSGGFANRQREAEGDAIPAEWRAVSIGKNQLVGCDAVGFAPLTKESLCRRPYRHCSLLAAFPSKMDGAVEQILRSKLEGF
jgi:hypothetical protein